MIIINEKKNYCDIKVNINFSFFHDMTLGKIPCRRYWRCTHFGSIEILDFRETYSGTKNV